MESLYVCLTEFVQAHSALTVLRNRLRILFLDLIQNGYVTTLECLRKDVHVQNIILFEYSSEDRALLSNTLQLTKMQANTVRRMKYLLAKWYAKIFDIINEKDIDADENENTEECLMILDDTDCYYKILGVDKTANLSDIKSAYKKLALIRHPDKGGTAEKVKHISLISSFVITCVFFSSNCLTQHT